MDPILATTGYTPSSAALPGIMSRTEAMMFPYIQQYTNYVNQMDLYNSLGLPYGSCNYNTNPVFGAQGTGNFDMTQHLNQLAENRQRMSEYNRARMVQERQEGLALSAPIERVKTAAEDLQRKIVENEQNQIPQALASYLAAVRAAYDPEGVADEKTIMDRARELYKEQTGTDIISSIKDNAHSSFLQGFINGSTFGFFGQHSADETISDITGQEVSTTSRNLKIAGKATGGAAVCAGVGACIGGIPGAIIGGIVGAIGGLLFT